MVRVSSPNLQRSVLWAIAAPLLLEHGVRRKAAGVAGPDSTWGLHIPSGAWFEAERHLNTAAVLALQANDPQRLAVGLSFQSYRALEVEDLISAEAFKDAALRDTRVDPGLRAYMNIQQAEIPARRGDRHAAAKMLTDVDRLIENLPAAEELPTSSYWYTPAVLLGHKGFVLEGTGRPVGGPADSGGFVGAHAGVVV